MAESHLNGLAMMFIHRQLNVVTSLKPVDVLKKWDVSGHRRIALAFDQKQKHSDDGTKSS